MEDRSRQKRDERTENLKSLDVTKEVRGLAVAVTLPVLLSSASINCRA